VYAPPRGEGCGRRRRRGGSRSRSRSCGSTRATLDRGRVVTRDELLQRLWGRRETHRDRTVDVFVRKLREKLDRPGANHSFIETRYGVGYKFEPVRK
jgi:hypothetical protein